MVKGNVYYSYLSFIQKGELDIFHLNLGVFFNFLTNGIPFVLGKEKNHYTTITKKKITPSYSHQPFISYVILDTFLNSSEP